MCLFLACGAALGFGTFAVWFHFQDVRCRQSLTRRLEIERRLAEFMMTPERAIGQTRAYRAIALSFDCLLVFTSVRLLTPLLPEWDDVLTVGGMMFLLLGLLCAALAQGIVSYNRPHILVQRERRNERGAKQAVSS